MSGEAVDATLGPEYRLIRQIGQGAFGRALLVERAVEPDAGDTFVIKQINVVAMGDKARREAEQEVKVSLLSLWQPFCTRPTPKPVSLCYHRFWRT
jgi:serine/threonine protein kinase